MPQHSEVAYFCYLALQLKGAGIFCHFKRPLYEWSRYSYLQLHHRGLRSDLKPGEQWKAGVGDAEEEK
jgi:hypothetical protein